MTKVWRSDIENCPLNKRVHFLCDYSRLPTTLHEIVGTLTTNPYNGTIIRGECLEGDPNIFYKSEIIMWACYATNEEAESLF